MRAGRNDHGETLIEILLSVAILGVAMVALLAGMGTAVTTAGVNARQTGQVQGLQSFVQAVLDAPYVNCATTYAPAGYSDPSGYAVTVGSVRYQQVGGWTLAGGSVYGGTCPAADQGSQQMTITIQKPDARVRDESLVVVKRNPCGPPDAPC